MADFSAFQPQGNTYVVDSSAAVRVIGSTTSVCYRIHNLGAATAWFGWAAANSDGTTPTVNNTAPTVTVSGQGVIGMLASSVEVFRFPPGSWFKASSGASFEITSGTGV
jgi:hypothetical protein